MCIYVSLAQSADLFAEIEGKVAGEVKLFGGIEGHLLNEGEDHLDLGTDFQGTEFVVALGEVEGETGFGIEARPEDSLCDAHITAGIYWGPSEFARMDNTSASAQTLADIQAYNQIYREAAEGDPVKGYGLLSIGMGTYSHNFQQGNNRRLMNGPYQMEPTEDCRVTISCTSNSLKPYVGFGYGGRLFPKRNDWKITGELGAMIWGGSPSQTTHDGTDLSKDVQDYPHTITTIVKNLFVYPVLSVRIAKTLF